MIMRKNTSWGAPFRRSNKPHNLTIEKQRDCWRFSVQTYQFSRRKIPIDEELAKNIARVFGGTATV